MKKHLFIIFGLFLLIHPTVFAAPPDELDNHEVFVRGAVIKIINQSTQVIAGSKIYQENLQVRLLEGVENGKVVSVSRTGDPSITANQIHTGETVVIDSKPDPSGQISYIVYEPYRLNNLWIAIAFFFILIVIVGGKKGIGAFIGLMVSLLVISLWIIPQIIAGQDPLHTAVIGACIILPVTTFIAHGFSLKTTIAVIGTALSLIFAGWLAGIVVQSMHLFGLGSEDIYQLQVGTPHPINTQGLLLAGILIGTLGALNDITTTQAMTLFTLVKENPKQKFAELFGKTMAIGREHIASLVNTLVLAYAGSSLAIFIFFALNPAHLPWWVILNNETTIEEIAKTLVGSSALILAVPITTFLAAFIALRATTYFDLIYHISDRLNILAPESKNTPSNLPIRKKKLLK